MIDLKNLAVSSLGALALSAACVGAAVAPARAAAPLSPAAWATHVDRQLSGTDTVVARGVQPGQVARPELALSFDADGRYTGAAVARSSGIAAVDAEALAVADHVRYPQLPVAWRGQPRTVTMRLAVGAAEDLAHARRPAVRPAAPLQVASR